MGRLLVFTVSPANLRGSQCPCPHLLSLRLISDRPLMYILTEVDPRSPDASCLGLRDSRTTQLQSQNAVFLKVECSHILRSVLRNFRSSSLRHLFPITMAPAPIRDWLRHGERVDGSASPSFNATHTSKRQKIVVVGLGMVAISFM